MYISEVVDQNMFSLFVSWELKNVVSIGCSSVVLMSYHYISLLYIVASDLKP
jgi:hypothetical protein